MSAVPRTARSTDRAPIRIAEKRLTTAVVATYANEGVITPQNAFRIDAIANSERLMEPLQQRAMEVVAWGMPWVRFDMLRQAFFRDAQARYGDIAFWSRPADWNVQWTTPTSFAFYTYFNFNTKSGPIVFDLPPTREAGLTGSLFSARDERVIDIGLRGVDRGRGAKYLLLPPHYKAVIPSDYIPVRCPTRNGYVLLNSPSSNATESGTVDLGLVGRMQLYPLGRVGDPPPQRFIDMSGKLFDAAIPLDDRFFDSIARMMSEESFEVCDLVARSQISFLGIGHDKPFRPDPATREVLTHAVRKVHACLMQSAQNRKRWWPGTSWRTGDAIWPRLPYSPETAACLGLDETNAQFFAAFSAPQKDVDACHSFCAFTDTKEGPLSGRFRYRLRVPANVPAKGGWSFTAYDLHTACFIRQSPRVGLGSADPSLQKNLDGSIDLYFGPEAPQGKDTNWIYTAPGKEWFGIFRMHTPERPVFDKSWILPNLEKMATYRTA